MAITTETLQVAGFRAAAAAAAIKKPGRLDLGLIVADQPAAAAGVFTRNQVKAAPVLLCRQRLRAGQAQAILVNSGNANACTGPAGLQDALQLTAAAARLLGLPERLILPASTGVIGQPLPVGRMEEALPALVARLRPEGLPEVAAAIMTTDTFPKTARVVEHFNGRTFTVAGVAKGAGMIHPDLATMLAFILTDAPVTPPILRAALRSGLATSFNRITVDGDTSTNDCVLVLASGAAGGPPINSLENREAEIFLSCLHQVMAKLAYQIVKDGEGARHVFRVVVQGARSQQDAFLAARAVALSPLVKTAIAGEDANWGRIMAALGHSGARIDPGQVEIWFDQEPLVQQGRGLGPAAEAAAQAVMRRGDFQILIRLNQGIYEDYYQTCDLTADYIAINATYRT